MAVTEANGATDELLQAQTMVFQHALTMVGTMSIKCALELSIPDIIHRHGQPITLSQLASALPVHPTKRVFVSRLVRVLVHAGFLAKQSNASGEEEGQEDAYHLTAFSRLLVTENPTSMSKYLLGFLDSYMISPWLFFGAWFQSDDPTIFHLAHGKSMFEFASENPRLNSLFNEAMVSETSLTMDFIIKEHNEIFQGLRSLVDIGGGIGAATRAIAEAFPALKCTVFDLPHVVATAPESTKVDFIGGNMFVHVPPANAIFLKLILHNWSDEDCLKILKRCKEAIPLKEEGGKVIVVDIVVNSNSNDLKLSEAQVLFDITMMAGFAGKEREEHEWKKIFFDAGFTEYKMKHVLGLRSIFEIYP